MRERETPQQICFPGEEYSAPSEYCVKYTEAVRGTHLTPVNPGLGGQWRRITELEVSLSYIHSKILSLLY
jgi:hypothetical protein